MFYDNVYPSYSGPDLIGSGLEGYILEQLKREWYLIVYSRKNKLSSMLYLLKKSYL